MAAIPSARGVTPDEAAAELGLPVGTVLSLAQAGLLTALPGLDETRFARSDIRAFLLRNQPPDPAADPDDRDDSGGVVLRFPTIAGMDEGDDALELLLSELDRRTEDMAGRVLEVFEQAFPEAARWPASRREEFVAEARLRFEAILTVAAAGESAAGDLLDDLTAVGRSAAWTGTPLPQILVALRISRDLVVQTALEVVEAWGRRWGLALALLLTRALPSLDRLTDAIAGGYWDAVVGIQAEGAARYETIVEHATDAIVEVDTEGHLVYANPAFGVLVGRPGQQLVGMQATDLLSLTQPAVTVDQLMEAAHAGRWAEVRVHRADGVERILQVRIHERHAHDAISGYLIVIRDVTADRELARQKDEFLALMTVELRSPLTIVLGLGVTLETYGAELSPERVARMGKAIHHHAERIARLADDLFDVSRLDSNTLLLSPRPVELRHVIEAALGMLATTDGIDDVEIRADAGVAVRADPRRLEQVVAHLVENALLHGAAPARIEVLEGDDTVELVVRDHGHGLPPGSEEVVFTRLHPSGDAPRYRDRAAGLGLSLVRGLVEAMGGRVVYESADDGGACFVVTLPRA